MLGPLPPHYLPALSADVAALPPGPPGALTRSFPCGRDKFWRIRQDEVVKLQVELKLPATAPRVVLFTDFNAASWQELAFRTADGQHFMLELNCAHLSPAVYHFRVKYTLDGQQWFWDRDHFSFLLLDPAGLRDIRMYTLIPTVSGTVRHWMQELPRIRAMGFNMVHLLPLTEMDTSASPYAARDLFGFDASYLDPTDPRPGREQFEDFVEQAKSLGLGLCMDLVFNHVGVHGELASKRPDWLEVDDAEADGIRRAGWSDGHTWHKWQDLALVDYEHPHDLARTQIWSYLAAYALFWARYADYTSGMVRLDNLHSSHPGFTRYLVRRLRAEFPDLLLFGEFFADARQVETVVLDCRLSLLLGTPWEHHFTPQLREYLQQVHRVAQRVRFMLPITSHDSGSPAQEFGTPKATVARYAISALFGCGFTGMPQGVEYGVPEQVEFIGRQPRREFKNGHDYSESITVLNRLMATHEVFQRGGNLRFVDDGHHAILGAWRFAPNRHDNDFILAVNLDIFHRQTLNVNLARHNLDLAGSRLVDELREGEVNPRDATLTIELAPCEVRVLKVVR